MTRLPHMHKQGEDGLSKTAMDQRCLLVLHRLRLPGPDCKSEAFGPGGAPRGALAFRSPGALGSSADFNRGPDMKRGDFRRSWEVRHLVPLLRTRRQWPLCFASTFNSVQSAPPQQNLHTKSGHLTAKCSENHLGEKSCDTCNLRIFTFSHAHRIFSYS